MIPTRSQRLRLLAHTRRLVGVMLPLGAATGLAVALGLHVLESGSRWAWELTFRHGVEYLLPLAALLVVTQWLTATGVGEVSLSADMDLAKHQPYAAFPFRRSLVKVIGCGLTIGLGGSTGIEGPAKWFGGAMGLQFHRLLHKAARSFYALRRTLSPSVVMVRAGAAASLGAVFRAPLSGALMAAELDGRLDATSLVPCLVAAASGFLVFAGWAGLSPLLPHAQPIQPGTREIGWALVLGVTCGAGANAFRWVKGRLQRRLAIVPLRWRGLAAGLGLLLLALPAHLFWGRAPITEGGGLEVVRLLLHEGHGGMRPLLFFCVKAAATALTLAGGGVGGTWVPAVVMGACLGAGLESALHVGPMGVLTLVGASAFAGAVHETLLVPVVFLAETTGQAGLVVPALVATTLSYLMAREVE